LISCKGGEDGGAFIKNDTLCTDGPSTLLGITRVAMAVPEQQSLGCFVWLLPEVFESIVVTTYTFALGGGGGGGGPIAGPAEMLTLASGCAANSA